MPTALKEVIVDELLKKTVLDLGEMVSYRPVSNLLFVGKVICTVVSQLQDFLKDTDYLDSFQLGFRPDFWDRICLVHLG